MFLHFAFELFPVTFDAIPIHDMAPWIDYDVELSKDTKCAVRLGYSNSCANMIHA
jgi:hypothetical protein